MAKSCLSLFPLTVFGVVEPALLIWAYITASQDPASFYAAQAPPFTTAASPAPAQGLVLVHQLTNVYLLLAALGAICSWTAHAQVARRYPVVVALADYGHVYACYRGVAPHVFWDPRQWNDMLWGAVGVGAALNALRWLTVFGAFGPLGGPRGPRARAGWKRA
ncbi:hypothetical protein F4804DRAFT_202316 [Jackrogersella minutella]|nr:hypothetical protein F4804DRAFT_202316 [Jackrogersella minutella]